MAHGVFISENCSFTKDGSKIRSAKNPSTSLDNGVPVVLTGLLDGERELWVCSKASASSDLGDIWITATVELIYDESKKYTIADFYNGINDSASERVPMRIVMLEKGDIFGLTAEVLSKTPSTSDAYIAPKADGWTVSGTETGAFAKFIGTTTNRGLTYYSFERV